MYITHIKEAAEYAAKKNCTLNIDLEGITIHMNKGGYIKSHCIPYATLEFARFNVLIKGIDTCIMAIDPHFPSMYD